jgi:hypothetical protein
MEELMKAYQLRAAGDLEDALKYVSTAFVSWPRNPMALLLQCLLLESLGREAEALQRVLEFGSISFLRGPVLTEFLDTTERILKAQG